MSAFRGDRVTDYREGSAARLLLWIAEDMTGRRDGHQFTKGPAVKIVVHIGRFDCFDKYQMAITSLENPSGKGATKAEAVANLLKAIQDRIDELTEARQQIENL